MDDIGLHLLDARFPLAVPLAEIARPQMPHIEDMIANLGALQSVTFKSVGPGGADVYDLKFEHGSLEWRIFLDAEGKIANQFFRPVP